jgi:periplasmic divalent cation tolerance protein
MDRSGGLRSRRRKGREPMDEAVFLYTTWPDAETAQAAGQAAVEQGLAACANVFAPMVSIYRWKGTVERAGETPMTLKTTQAQAPALRALIAARHPYELPCILALPVAAAASSPEFLAWIAAETG